MPFVYQCGLLALILMLLGSGEHDHPDLRILPDFRPWSPSAYENEYMSDINCFYGSVQCVNPNVEKWNIVVLVRDWIRHIWLLLTSRQSVTV